MENDNKVNLFDRYLLREMTQPERAEFERELESDQDLREELELHRDVIKGIEMDSLKDLKYKLQQDDISSSSGATTQSVFWKVAASVILISVVGYIVYEQGFANNPKALYEEYYSAYPNVVSPVNRSDDNGNTDSYQLYERGDLEEALASLQTHSEKSDTVNFYLGQVHLAMGEPAKARSALEVVNDGSNFYEAAQWYLALSYLKSGDTDQCNTLLQQISKSESSYSTKAADLLEEL